MLPNVNDNLLPQIISKSEKTPEDTDENEEPIDCDNQELAYGAGDAVIALFIVAPLVVSAWRGTWGIMELHPNMFPYTQIFVLGIVIHVSFALVRSHLLSRAQNAWGKQARAGRWLRERVICRAYTYIFILSNIMHWRGGWGLLDMTVASFVDVGDPHGPVLYAVFIIIFYIIIVWIRSARNLLAAPYFLFTDGKEATYLFTTRFQKQALFRAQGRGMSSRARAPQPVQSTVHVPPTSKEADKQNDL